MSRVGRLRNEQQQVRRSRVGAPNDESSEAGIFPTPGPVAGAGAGSGQGAEAGSAQGTQGASGSANASDSVNFLDYLGTVTRTAGETYSNFTGRPSSPPAATANATARSGSSFTTYLPYIIGGVVILVIAVVLLGRRN